MRKIILPIIFLTFFLVTASLTANVGLAYVKPTPTLIPSPTPTLIPTPKDVPRVDLTQTKNENTSPLENLLQKQELTNLNPTNLLKHAIHSSVLAGVPANTIVLLILLPLIAALIAAARNLIGIRGFGIFLPAALSVTFVATGPIIGICLFVIILLFSTSVRFLLRKFRIRLQYLPRMALILWAVSLGILSILFLMPVLQIPEISGVSIFAVLILILLSEEITRVQLGKSLRVALDLGIETLILALLSYLVLSLKFLQNFALLNPEIVLIGTMIFDLILGRYAGLRLREVWRFRKLVNGG